MHGPNTVLLPGTLCDPTLWAGVAVPAGAVILPSVRGHTLADAARRVLDLVPPKEPLHLVGFSLGAIVAFEALRQAPERLARLTLISANPHAPTQTQLDTWAEHERQVRAGGFETVVHALSEAAGAHGQAVLEMARRVGPEVYLEQLGLLRSRPDSRADLAQFSGPLTVLVGQQDHLTPPHLADELGALVPHAQVIKVPGAGHYLPLDAPRPISAVLGGVAHA